MGQCVKQNRNTKHAAHAHAASPRTMGTLSHGFRSYCLHLMPKVNLPHNTALMSPALALPSHVSALLDVIFAWSSGRSRTSHYRHLLATHVKHIHPKVPARRGRTLRTRIQPRQRWCEQQLLSRPGMPARAGHMLAACLPPAALCTGTRSSVVWSPGSRSPHGRHALRQPDA